MSVTTVHVDVLHEDSALGGVEGGCQPVSSNNLVDDLILRCLRQVHLDDEVVDVVGEGGQGPALDGTLSRGPGGQGLEKGAPRSGSLWWEHAGCMAGDPAVWQTRSLVDGMNAMSFHGIDVRDVGPPKTISSGGV